MEDDYKVWEWHFVSPRLTLEVRKGVQWLEINSLIIGARDINAKKLNRRLFQIKEGIRISKTGKW